ncbi:hypothetical protein SCP_0307540 [Sparassis crispa]|uniref:Uncharacterized protein n=1 Tax=Sparassis crispa TaxID=139825 RepID=A0A401GFX8_9APHY|nr:hypothetical protein SCP_0307540 [Sparassis crispa]GBE81031.1 hypothetical protein SCP_0307540 [Sparassis crispa]
MSPAASGIPRYYEDIDIAASPYETWMALPAPWPPTTLMKNRAYVLHVSSCQIRPDHHHCDAAGHADHEHACSIRRKVRECRPR